MQAPSGRNSCSLAIAIILLLGLHGLLSGSAEAQTFTLFNIPTAGSQPTGIATGPDGNLWFTETAGNKIGRITPSGVITEFTLPGANSQPFGITAGGDGNIWFTEATGNRIGRITPAGVITEIPIPTLDSNPKGITLGPDGLIWFTQYDSNKIGRVNANGTISEFQVAGRPYGITFGSDNNIWFTEFNGSQIGKMTIAGVTIIECAASSTNPTAITAGPDGQLWFTTETGNQVTRMPTNCGNTDHPIPTGNSTPRGITTGSDGSLWFTEAAGNKVGRVLASGVLSEFAIPVANTGPEGITWGPDGNLWFAAKTGNAIGRLVPPAVAAALLAAVLPSSRSVRHGNIITPGTPATIFATILNTSPVAANGCGIAPIRPVSGLFSFQTTDPATNQLTGTQNTRVAIAPNGGLQTFLITYRPAGPLPSTNVEFGYDCTGFPAVSSIVGVNTALFTFSATPVADVIAVGLTPTNDGYSRTGGNNGTGIFVIAATNIGIATSLTARARISDASLPLTATVCRTNPGNGQCLAPASPTVTGTINQNEDTTWTAFLAANGPVAQDAAKNRVFFEFVDAGGIVRGSTSTAVTTQ